MGCLHSYTVMVTNTVKMEVQMIQTISLNKEQEIDLLATNIEALFHRHKLTKEEFAVIYGYIYLAKEELLQLEDLKFIITNKLLKSQLI
jgi:hypothetical protein